MSIYTNGYIRNAPDVGWWLSQVRGGIAFRKKYAHQEDWNRWRSYYRGKFPKGVLPVNLFFKMIRSTVPKIYFRDPSVSVYATKPTPEQAALAQLVERIDNKLIRTMNMKKEIKRMIQQTWMFGTSAGKLGFGGEFTPTPDVWETEAPEHITRSFKRRVEYSAGVTPNMPWFKAVHPGYLILPDGLDDFDNTPWVAMWIKRPIDDVRSDPRLKHTADLKPRTGPVPTTSVGGGFNPGSRPDEVDLIEIRDRRTGKCAIISPNASGKVLYYEDDALQNNNRTNIYPLIFNPDDEIFWGVPDSVILDPQQHEINEIRTLQMKHRRLSILKLLYKVNSIEPAEVEKLLNGDVGAGVKIIGDLSDIERFQTGDIPQALFMADQTIQGDVRDMLGFSRNQSGEYSGQKSHSAPTAAEATIVQQASEIRIDERRDSVADLIVQVFEDTNPLIFEKWQDEQVVQVIGASGLPVWVAFKPAMLKAARYEMNIDPDSTLPETKEMRQGKAVQVYGLLKTNPLIDPQLLTKYLLRELHGVEYDNLMKAMQQAVAQGAPGSNPEQPMDGRQYMESMTRGAGDGA